MVNGAARKAVTLDDILTDFQNRFQLIESDLRARRGFQSTETKPLGTSSGTSQAGIAGFLKIAGDAIDGPFAITPQIATIIDGDVNVSKDLAQAYTSYIILNPEDGLDDTLDTITGVSFPGQIVIFQVFNKPITFSNAGNIQGKDIEVVAGDTISFIFDSLGTWRLWTAGAGGTSGYDLILNDGNPLPQRSTINITGPGGTAIDNPGLDRTDINFPGVEFFGPWTAAHNAGIKSLTNLRALTIVDVNGDTTGLLSGIDGFGTDFTLPVGDKFRFVEGITDIFEISALGIVLASGKRLDMNKGVINKAEAIEFDPTQIFTPISTNTIGFDNNQLAIKYNTSSLTNFHRFQAGGEFLAAISRIGPNQGAVFAHFLQGQIAAAFQKFFLSTFNNVSPQNGDFWLDIGTGLYQFRQNGITVGLGGTGALDGVQDFHPWLLHETSQYDEEVFMSNSKVGAGTTTVTKLEDLLYFVPIYLAKRTRLTSLAVTVSAPAPAGTYTLSFGIYANRTDGQNYPEDRILSGNLLSTGTGVKRANFTGTNLDPGLYWLAFNCTTDDLVMEYFLEGDCNSAGYKLDTSSFQPIIGLFTSSTATLLPGTAPDDLIEASQSSNGVPAIYAKFIPNTS